MTPIPSATQWGSSSASKRALLIHGATSSSQTWETIAQALVRAGYLVTAPNMLGHGYRRSDDLRLSALAEDLRSYFAEGIVYDVIIGHSFGGDVALALIPFLPADRRTAVVLVDPGIESSQETLAAKEASYSEEIRNVRSIEAHMAEHPAWTHRDVVSRVLALHMAQGDLVKQIFAQNVPFTFKHLFTTIPPHVDVVVLMADPELSKTCPPDQVPVHPRVRSVLVKGSGHWIHHENPDVVVSTALGAVERLTGMEPAGRLEHVGTPRSSGRPVVG
ncbi:Alpha/Beta hydrolase protein [Melanogaster broomeanus]|nr:Alpha/Beta hydrolase protein [Melanogaster broomeanus]